MTRFSPINLAALPAPEAIRQINVETILAEAKVQFTTIYNALRVKRPSMPPIDSIDLEFDPVNIALQVFATREMTIRQDANDNYKAASLVYALMNNLENKVGELGVARKVIDVGDPNAVPPIPPTYETDTSLRFRAQLAWEALSTAGPEGAYYFHALTADARVKDAAIFGPESSYVDPGQVLVTILSTEDGGEASSELLEIVENYLADGNRRPLTDQVIVEAAEIEEYAVVMQITVRPGASAEVVRQAAIEAVTKYTVDQFFIGSEIYKNRIDAAGYVGDDPGTSVVLKVETSSPSADILTDPRSAPKCTSITITAVVG